MTISAKDRSFRRKLGYLFAIGALLVPLSLLSHPATRDIKEAKGRPGGKLARLRDQFELNQTELGEIDPAGETIKLATLGLRGVAVDILWYKANQYQMKKDWTNLRATLEQISKLQPHSIGVWQYQAWNLSYNVAVAFDDYHDKYYWIIEGIKFLQKGIQANEHEPKLWRDVGWFISHKIGRADEAKQYRQLFKEDDQFHGSRPPEARDNWLVGKSWFRESEQRDDGRRTLGAIPEIFYANAPMCQFYYADALEKDGRFGEVASRAWERAGADWREFGEREFVAPNGTRFRMNEQEKYDKEAARAAAALEKLAPGLRDKLVNEKIARLAPKERKARATPADKRTDEQLQLVAQTDMQVEVTMKRWRGE